MTHTQDEQRTRPRPRTRPARRRQKADPLAAVVAAAASVEPDPLVRDWLAALAGPDAEGGSSFDCPAHSPTALARSAQAEMN